MKAKTILIILALLVLLPTSVQSAESFHKASPRVQSEAMDPEDLETFLDEFFSQQMAELHIPGAAIVVVKDGKTIFSKGYGLADIERQVPVDPAQTIMRVGSVSKLFAATAAMQLVEQGRLDLDTDVNQYLTSLQIPDNGYEPVTLRQLLTHTAGFEDYVIGTATIDPDAHLPLGEYLASSSGPERVLEPGTVHSYSNYSFALIGQLIEDVSGTPFAQYVDENILQPLGMTRSTFEQPLPPGLAEDLAVGYFVTDGVYEPGDFLFLQEPPEGSMSSTAVDMARFMIAHLQDGRYEDVQILGEDVAQQMHVQQFTHHPELPGMGYAFKERLVNGERLIGHGGDVGTYSSQMILHPEDNWGFFVNYNVFNDALRERLITAFMDRYYPLAEQELPLETLEMSEDELARFAGPYRWVRHSRSTIGKVVALLPGPTNVIILANPDGTLSVTFFGVEAEWRFAPVGPLTFKQVQGGVQQMDVYEFDVGDTLVFRENESGEITFAFMPLQNVALEKIAWYEGGDAQMGTMFMLLMVFLSPFIVWPLGKLIARIRKRETRSTKGSRWARYTALLVSGLNFIFLVTIIIGMGDPTLGVPPLIQVALVIPLITILLTLVMSWQLFVTWSKGYWSFGGRLYYTLIWLAAVVFILFAGYWNLLGWRF